MDERMTELVGYVDGLSLKSPLVYAQPVLVVAALSLRPQSLWDADGTQGLHDEGRPWERQVGFQAQSQFVEEAETVVELTAHAVGKDVMALVGVGV